MDISTLGLHLCLSKGYLQTIRNAIPSESAIHGIGLFTTVDLDPHQVLAVLDGQHIPVDEASGDLLNLEWNALSQTELLVRPIRTSYGYINHSSRPNLSISLPSLEIRTLYTVRAGTELLLDYREQPLPEAYLNSPHAGFLRTPR